MLEEVHSYLLSSYLAPSLPPSPVGLNVQYLAAAQREERFRGGEVEVIEKSEKGQQKAFTARKSHFCIPRKGIARPQFKFCLSAI